jgi:hypothetical protein
MEFQVDADRREQFLDLANTPRLIYTRNGPEGILVCRPPPNPLVGSNNERQKRGYETNSLCNLRDSDAR